MCILLAGVVSSHSGGVSAASASIEELTLIVNRLVEQNEQQEAQINGLRQELRAFTASTTAQRHRDIAWRQKTDTAVRSLQTTSRSQDANTQPTEGARRGLLPSSGSTCASSSDEPRLFVNGVCSCAGGLLVEGRNVTKELDELMHNAQEGAPGATVVATTAPVTTTTTTAALAMSCVLLESPFIVGSVTGDSTNLEGATGIGVSADGDHVYVTGRFSDSLVVFDISDRTNPVMTGLISGDSINLDTPKAVAVSPISDFVFVATNDQVAIVDVSNPALPVVINHTASSGYASGLVLSADGTTLFIAENDGLAIIDVSAPSSPVLLGSIKDSSTMDGQSGIALSPDESLAFVATNSLDGIAIVNVTDPTNLVVVGSHNGDSTNIDGPNSLAVSADGNSVYVVSTWSDNLAVVDVRNPASPSAVDTGVASNGYSVMVSPSGDYIFVDGSNRVSIQSASDFSDAAFASLSGGAFFSFAMAPHEVMFVPLYNGDGFAIVQWENCTTA
eukprot:INCI5500.1.p1 GENE.INCI5500.1~~INCI5500.1.p1  ORF type:complete len:549 (-),score=103.10 INCI5500.1:936-2444(-)